VISRIDLLRHGETERGGGFRGSLDDALTESGWRQMHASVAQTRPWQLIVSSPLRRCADFAQVLADRLNLPLTFDQDLRELHFGDWEGRSAAELMVTDADSLGRFWADPFGFTPPAGEPLDEFQARVLRGVRKMVDSPEKHVLVITHAGVMRLLIAYAHGRVQQLLEVEVAHAQLTSLLADAEGCLRVD
jgi:alpha-ribazole phosphatase